MKKVSKYQKIILELCCLNCYYEKLHDNHKLIQISDSDSLQKENISLESITSDSKEISEKINELKNKLEKEINHIKELYEKTVQEITKSFKTQHEILIREEKKLKE